MTVLGAVLQPVFSVANAAAEHGSLVYASAGAAAGACVGLTKAAKEAFFSLPVLVKDPVLVVKGTKHSKGAEANGFAEPPKRTLENGVKAIHDTAASAAAHAKGAHLPNDSKIAQLSQKPTAHVEAKG